MSITDEKWSLDSEDPRTIVDENGNPILTCNMPGATLEDDYETARAVVVLPEALAALKDAAQYELDDGPCWCMSPCRPGRPAPKCARNRDILRRAGVPE